MPLPLRVAKWNFVCFFNSSNEFVLTCLPIVLQFTTHQNSMPIPLPTVQFCSSSATSSPFKINISLSPSSSTILRVYSLAHKHNTHHRAQFCVTEIIFLQIHPTLCNLCHLFEQLYIISRHKIGTYNVCT